MNSVAAIFIILCKWGLRNSSTGGTKFRFGFVESNGIHLATENIMWSLNSLCSNTISRSIAAIFNLCIQTWRRSFSLCTCWFLETSDPYLPPCKRAQTCHKVHDFFKLGPSYMEKISATYYGGFCWPCIPLI